MKAVFAETFDGAFTTEDKLSEIAVIVLEFTAAGRAKLLIEQLLLTEILGCCIRTVVLGTLGDKAVLCTLKFVADCIVVISKGWVGTIFGTVDDCKEIIPALDCIIGQTVEIVLNVVFKSADFVIAVVFRPVITSVETIFNAEVAFGTAVSIKLLHISVVEEPKIVHAVCFIVSVVLTFVIVLETKFNSFSVILLISADSVLDFKLGERFDSDITDFELSASVLLSVEYKFWQVTFEVEDATEIFAGLKDKLVDKIGALTEETEIVERFIVVTGGVKDIDAILTAPEDIEIRELAFEVETESVIVESGLVMVIQVEGVGPVVKVWCIWIGVAVKIDFESREAEERFAVQPQIE